MTGVRVFAERQPAVAASALGFAILNNVVASTMFLAIYRFDLAAFADRGALVDRGPGVADLLRWAAVIDMVGYLAMAPVVIYLHRRLVLAAERLRRRGLVAPLTFCGLAFVLVGSIGAVLIASVGPALLEAGAGEPVAEMRRASPSKRWPAPYTSGCGGFSSRCCSAYG
ncbi:MAG: hypothetical protein ACRDGJ_00500 [Candidatus Limnocylindria bacterium]